MAKVKCEMERRIERGFKMLNLNHKRLDVWKVSKNFVIKIYMFTENFPKFEIYGLSNQIRRTAVSIPSNIAEGAARKSASERKRFYEISRSSLVVLDTQLEISLDLTYGSPNEIDEI